MDIELKPATENDLDAMSELHAASYPAMQLAPADSKRRMVDSTLVSLGQRVAAYEAGALVGMYALLRFEMWLGGRAVPAGGLAGVAVAAHARGRGIASILVEHAVSSCRTEERPLCLLYPFREDFYHRLGFVRVAAQRRMRYSPRWLPRALAREARVRPAELGDLQRLVAVHGEFCARTNGALSRSERHMAKMMMSHRAVVATTGEGGAVEGYLYYRVDAPSDQRQAIEVAELVFSTEAAHRALLGFLVQQRDQIDEVRQDLALDDPLPSLLVQDRALDAPQVRELHQDLGSYAHGAMARVLDVPGALLARGGYGDGSIAITVDGSAYCLTVKEGVAEVSHEPSVASASESGSPSERPRGCRLACDERTFTRIYTGALRPSQAVRLELARLEYGSAAEADRMLALPQPFVTDTF